MVKKILNEMRQSRPYDQRQTSGYKYNERQSIVVAEQKGVVVQMRKASRLLHALSLARVIWFIFVRALCSLGRIE